VTTVARRPKIRQNNSKSTKNVHFRTSWRLQSLKIWQKVAKKRPENLFFNLLEKSNTVIACVFLDFFYRERAKNILLTIWQQRE
jgi:hypothetical protein